jgi:hypothetical protein
MGLRSGGARTMKKLILTIIIVVMLAIPAFASFPTTPILDNFNRANEGPPPSANWTSFHTFIAGKVSSNTCIVNGASTAQYWNPKVFIPDEEVYMKISTKPANGNVARLCLRIQGANLATEDGYQLHFAADAGTDIITIRKVSSGTSSVLLTISPAQEVSSGDSLGFSAVGSTLTAWYKSGSGAWVSLGSTTDSSFPSGGYIGMYLPNDAAVVIDDFGGGEVGDNGKFLLLF